jgi:integrase/recombinase XerC
MWRIGTTGRSAAAEAQRTPLKVTGEHRAGYCDHLLYALALGTGLREHELIALSVGDVFRDGKPRRRLLLSVFLELRVKQLTRLLYGRKSEMLTKENLAQLELAFGGDAGDGAEMVASELVH